MPAGGVVGWKGSYFQFARGRNTHPSTWRKGEDTLSEMAGKTVLLFQLGIDDLLKKGEKPMERERGGFVQAQSLPRNDHSGSRQLVVKYYDRTSPVAERMGREENS